MIPYDDWLGTAQRLAVGMQVRVHHGRERTAAMTIANEHDRWWVYCQRCKTGGVKFKDHVTIGLKPPDRPSLEIPADMVGVSSDYIHVYRFLVSKGIDPCVITEPIWYSAKEQRVLFKTPQGWLGRDITGRSQQKWITYDQQHYAGTVQNGIVIVTEDYLSALKVKYVVPEHSVVSSLGTAVHSALAYDLTKHATGVLVMYDGDKAGISGSLKVWRQLKALGLNVRPACAPQGKDPKDLTFAEIKERVQQCSTFV